MAYVGKGPEQVLSGVASKYTFTGDGSTVNFDITTDIPAGGENDIQVFVDNVRQEPGSSASYTVGVDGSGNLRRITFTTAPEASQSIYVINPRRLEALGTIPDNSVTAGKISPNAISGQTELAEAAADTDAYLIYDASAGQIKKILASNVTPNETLITGKTELAEESADGDFLLIYDTSAGTLKKIQRSNVVLQPPTFSSVSPTNVLTGDGTGNATFTITGTNFTSGSTARLITANGNAVAFDSQTRDSTTQITGVIAVSSLSNANEPYGVQILGGNGLNSQTATGQININAQPVFVTASGSLGSGRTGALSFSVNATDPESAGNVTFELQSGSLPPGLSLTNSGANGGTGIISGTVSPLPDAATVYSFVLRAVDAASNTTSRSFSITINGATSQSFTSSGTFSVPSGITSVDVLVVAGGGAGSVQHSGGGGAGGLIFMPGYPVTPGGTVSVTVGCGGTGQPASPNAPVGPGQTGQDSAFGTLTAKGGGGGGNHCGGGAQSGGSGGGGASSSPNPAPAAGGAATQPTQPGNSGAYGFGNAGGASANPSSGPVYAGGGGGGAGAVGDNGSNTPSPLGNGGQGGIGKAYTIADGTTPVYYAGGGGGGAHCNGGGCEPGATARAGGLGGQGGGGDANQGVSSPTVPTALRSGQAGQANKGGGAGSNAAWGVACGGPGGKGIVIVRY
jgi:hypothetical protein